MRIVFFGTSEFSAGILDLLRTLDHSIVAIVTRPDRAQGRNLKLKPCPVKEFASEFLPDVPLFQPEKASTEAFSDQLRSFHPDLFIVVAYGEILRTNILSIPSKAALNIHTSLLPKYRGAAPIQRCLMQGESFSGVTFMEMVLKMDAGDVLRQEVVSIDPDMNVEQLEMALLEASKSAIPELLSRFDYYYTHKKAQDEALVTFASKISVEDCVPDWTRTSQEIHNQIRALSPFPGVFVKIKFGQDVKRVKFLSSKVLDLPSKETGQLLVDRKSMKISCKNGLVEILSLQVEGKKPMRVEEFLRGVSCSLSLES